MAELAAMPHVLIFPFPLQGHVPTMLKLAELISDAGIHVTFLNTDNIHRRLLRSSSAFKRLSERPTFRFRTIPDGLPEDDPRSFLQFMNLEESLRARSRESYRELLTPVVDLNGWSPVSCVIADGIFRLAFEVPYEMDIPVMIFRTSSACSVWAYYCIPELIERGELPFPEKADMDDLMPGVKGMEGFIRRRDLPGLVRNVKSASDPSLQYLIDFSNNLHRARALILNTTERLEANTLSYIRSICPITYTIGPLQLLYKNLKNSIGDISFDKQSIGSISVWKEDRSCMTWLDRQPHKSVIYISFGSITVMTRDVLVEFWHGLVNSGHRFLWVIRPDMVQGGMNTKEAVPGTSTERGCLVEWAPQEEVLAHPAVGCFLTHSGWNSTLESIVAGVPMICWPFFADQQMNSRFVDEVWKIGIDMKDMYGRSVIEKMVRKVMDGDEAEIFRKRASETAKAVQINAELEGRFSYMNFQKLVWHVKSLN